MPVFARKPADPAAAPVDSPLGELIPLAWIEEDGLMVTTDGRLVRLVAIDRAPNLYSSTPDDLNRIESIWHRAAAEIPDEQELWWIAMRDPLPIQDAVAEDHAAMRTAIELDRIHGDLEIARTRKRFEAMTERTIAAGAVGEIAASRTRHYAAVVFNPKPETAAETLDDLRQMFTPGGGLSPSVLDFPRFQSAAIESDSMVDTIITLLTDLDAGPRRVEPVEALALLWERLHPAARHLPDLEELAELPGFLRHEDEETGQRARADLLRALTRAYPEHGTPEAGISTADSRWLRHNDGTLEEVLHLSTVPQQTDLVFLSTLIEVPIAATLVVRISPGSRLRTRQWARLRDRQKSAAVRDRERRGKDVSDEAVMASEEAREAVMELVTTQGASIYKVSAYLSLRCPWGDEEVLSRTAQRLSKHAMAQYDARLLRGRFLSRDGFVSTLPLGTDRLNAQRSYSQRSMSHMVPVSSSRCGMDSGIYLGWSDPGATLERLDPFSPDNPNHLMLVAGRSGRGKTFAVNVMLKRAIERGMQGRIIDASSTDTAEGGKREHGHYDPLLAYVPRARRVSIGTGGGDVLSPWDTPDVAAVPGAHIETLLTVHDLLIGDRGQGGDDPILGADHRALLAKGIHAVYERCAATGERPCESLLMEELDSAQADEEDEGLRSRYAQLMLRLEPYVADGHLAYLLDHETTVPKDSPLIVFDLAGTPQELMGAVIVIATAHVEGEAAALKRKRDSGEIPTELAGRSPMLGRMFLAIDEGHMVVNTKAGGAYMNRQARRSRHLALWFIFISQQLMDLDSTQGRAMLSQASMILQAGDRRSTVAAAAGAAGLTDTDLDAIANLTTKKGVFSEIYLVHERGRGVVRLALSEEERWALTSDPLSGHALQRAAMLEAEGDQWKALALLANPAWRAAHS